MKDNTPNDSDSNRQAKPRKGPLTQPVLKLLRPMRQIPEHPLAGVVRRCVGAVIDTLLLVVLVGAIVLLAGMVPITGLGHDALPMLLACLGVFLYYILFEGLLGATPGKLLLGMRVCSEDGRRCTVTQAIIRMVCRLPDYFFLAGVMLMTVTVHRQRLGDLLARTVVVMKNKMESKR